MFGEPFDPKGELLIYEHCRPHWSQAGAVVFITFRTHDSIPREVVERWDREKEEWLRLRGDRVVIGRSEGDVLIPHDAMISGRHAELSRRVEGG